MSESGRPTPAADGGRSSPPAHSADLDRSAAHRPDRRWLAWDTFSKRGPDHHHLLRDGRRPHRRPVAAQVQERGDGHGEEHHRLARLRQVLVTVETVREAEPLLNDKTIFWVVKPELFAGNITGLETLLSGSYIGMRPSTEKGVARHHFIGKQDPPVLQAWAKGTTFKLQTQAAGLDQPGFAGLLPRSRGRHGAGLGPRGSGEQRHHPRLRARAVRQIRPRRHVVLECFRHVGKVGRWRHSVQMESLRAVLLGGIAFETRRTASSPSPANNQFPLYGNLEMARRRASAGRSCSCHTSRAPSPDWTGADVTLHGLKIGEVTDVSLVYDPQARSHRGAGPLPRRSRPHRQHRVGRARPEKLAEEMVRRGMRATLQSPSLITGQKIIALERIAGAAGRAETRGRRLCHSDLRNRRLRQHHPIGQRAPVQDQPHRFRPHRQEPPGAAAGLDNTINGPQLKKTLAALEKAMVDVQDIAARLDTDAAPALKRLPEIAAQLQNSLTQANAERSARAACGSGSGRRR